MTWVWKGKGGGWPSSRSAVLRQDRTSVRDPVSVLLHYIVWGAHRKMALGWRWVHTRVPLSGEAQEWTELTSSDSTVIVVLLTDFDFVILLSLCLSYKYADGEKQIPERTCPTMPFPLSRDCMQKVSSLVLRTALSPAMICTGTLVLSIAETNPPPPPQETTPKKEKAMYSRFDRLVFRGASPCCPIHPVPICDCSPIDERKSRNPGICPVIGEYHYVFPQDMNGVVGNMYNAAYKIASGKNAI